MTQSSSSSSVSVPPSIQDSLVFYWNLVDHAVIPPGFEDAFCGFSEAWTQAAARDDHRKSLWNNESSAVTLTIRPFCITESTAGGGPVLGNPEVL